MKFEELMGLTLKEITQKGVERILFKTTLGRCFVMHHHQDCCENVSIEDVCGDLSGLVGSPILLAEESSNQREEKYGSNTWTFYKICTLAEAVSIRWYGESNGYYSESVDFGEISPDEYKEMMEDNENG